MLEITRLTPLDAMLACLVAHSNEGAVAVVHVPVRVVWREALQVPQRVVLDHGQRQAAKVRSAANLDLPRSMAQHA